ncbi:hypothetical protein [Prosthecodimorpha staleyi]|uniref:TNase-like domain-containing protein n=1 Tax=Prosthecodimorpha staleyi TaxID=2840188 RepID=A0A947DBE4_9HYPH|nr:hypothetical protein [Prosthecodimorpha staleyi]MBT9291149.1 hypothetical protein [Prosthecodimorpha staleyi]
MPVWLAVAGSVALPPAAMAPGAAVADEDPCLGGEGEAVRAVRALSGDGFRLDDGRVVRLALVAAPRISLPAHRGHGAVTMAEAASETGMPDAPSDAAGEADRAAGPDGAEADDDAGGASGDMPRDQDGAGSGAAVGDGRNRAAGLGGPEGDPAGLAAGAGMTADAAPVERAARAELARLVEGRDLLLHGGRIDRHGRTIAQAADAATGQGIAAALAAVGAVRVMPAGRGGGAGQDGACIRHLIAAEATARAAGRGLWAEPAFAVRRADDPALAAAAGSYVLVEGKVLSTGRSGPRHYLNFGTDFRSDFTAVIDDKDTARFTRAGVGPAALKGRVVRLRGWLDDRDGGFMRLGLPEEIEWVR